MQKEMSATEEHIKSILSVIPESPGCYQYFDEKGTIIYVGKAKNLKRRVSSYFNKEHDSNKTRVLVKQIRDIKYFVVDTEEDALLLENNLIKQYRPRYNVLLKDDKTYPSIVVKNEYFPRIFQTRNIVRDGSRYYGPYPSIYTAKVMLQMLKDCIRCVPANTLLPPNPSPKEDIKFASNTISSGAKDLVKDCRHWRNTNKTFPR